MKAAIDAHIGFRIGILDDDAEDYAADFTGSRWTLFEETCTEPAVARVEIEPASATIRAGGTVELTARAFDESGNELTSVPFSWESDDPAIATVWPTTGPTVTVTGGSEGTTSIKVIAGDEIAAALDHSEITVSKLSFAGTWQGYIVAYQVVSPAVLTLSQSPWPYDWYPECGLVDWLDCLLVSGTVVWLTDSWIWSGYWQLELPPHPCTVSGRAAIDHRVGNGDWWMTVDCGTGVDIFGVELRLWQHFRLDLRGPLMEDGYEDVLFQRQECYPDCT